mmetsp:Transcript_18770/g.28570  ORF Transcript_18770/g.28570 Transcript_18770/m.28570 type:complete len:357 (-) Transcript_18770:1598-2668(-)
MAAKRRLVDDLLRGENHQILNRSSGGRPEACLHPVWREKVIKWYFSIVSALDRQHHSPDGPFNRSSVHVTTALLDSYLLALPSELALRYKHDRAAYQLLATTCLLIGMRLTQHDQQRKSQVPSENENSDGNDRPTCQLKRAKTHRHHMDQADHQDVDAGAENGSPSHGRPQASCSSTTMVVIPTAATILQMSAAPKTISESKILTMVREVTGSRAFPRSHVITALDYIRVLTSSTQEENSDVKLTQEVAEEAYRLADISLTDVSLIGCRPSVVASAAITLALFRSHHGSRDMVSLRQDVCATIVGEDPAFQVAVRKVEAKLLAAAHQATHALAPRQMQMNPPIMHRATAHLIPLEE